jgi:Na+/proline symporter
VPKEIILKADSGSETNDKDYVFFHFILNYLPKGLIGLLLAVIISAAMSSTASGLNALASTQPTFTNVT